MNPLPCFRLSLWALCTLLVSLISLSNAERLIQSKSLNPCQKNSSFSASLFNVVFTPDNRTVHIDVIGVSSIQGNITADVEVIAYGHRVVRQSLDPCKLKLDGLCPMSTGQFNLTTNFQNIGSDVINRVPGAAYSVPDLDGIVRVYIASATTGARLACVEAELSNAKTVYQKGVGWTTAVIAGLGLIASAITSGLGHSNTAAHIAANALSLFGYFQAQAMIGMCAVNVPPIVHSWTQNFAWSMGIMEVGFMQKAFAWYQRATGGQPAILLSSLSTASVDIQKRSLDTVHRLFLRSYEELVKRAEPGAEVNSSIVVRGIERMAFSAGIESTNLFMTGLTFFIIFVLVVIVAVVAFKAICEAGIKAGWFKWDKFQDFRKGWRTVLKGILFRLTLIGYPQMCVLCLWELTQRDSAAQVVLALFFFLAMSTTLSWAAWKVIRLAKQSATLHQNPGYFLYADPAALNKWGFLYVQFRATAYYFILPVLVYTLVKGAFIGLAQKNGKMQAIALVLIELLFLVGVSILRPWMDKKTNTFNIAIAAINLVNVVFLLIFTEIFKQKDIVTGVSGVVFFVINAVFALVYLVLVLISSLWALFSKNPDTRYQPMRDDRASFTKSKTQLNTELDALGATARGDGRTSYKRDLDDDETSSLSSAAPVRNKEEPFRAGAAGPLPSQRPMTQREPRSPADSSLPLFANSDASRPDLQPYSRTGSPHSNIAAHRQQSNQSPWQRGAGYDKA